VREVVADGVSGIVCGSFRELTEAVDRAARIDRRECRQHALDNFSSRRMADGYELAYAKVKERVPALRAS
jgi:hypothetical protein